MIVTLSIFYYLYLVVVFIFVLFGLFNIYHLLRFGFATVANVFTIFIFIVAGFIILSSSFELLVLVDWTQPLFDLKNFSFLSNNLILK